MMEPSSTNGIKVEAPIAPGLITEINVDSCRPLRLGELKSIRIPKGTLALDGEKEIEFNAEDQVKNNFRPFGTMEHQYRQKSWECLQKNI